MADPNPWTDNPWTTQGKAFKDWTTTEALDAARKLAEQLKSDPDLKGSACQILFPLIDWALDILDDYNKLTGDQVTMEEVAKTFACIGLATPEFLAALLGNLVLFKRRQYGAMDPCMIASMARLGMCYLRNAMNQTLAPDLLEFWLFGKAADTANLSVESVQLTDPEGQAFGQTLSYKPVESSTVMARIGTLIDGAVEDAYLPLLSKICARLQAPANTRFPKGAQRVLNQAIEFAPGRNALQEDGFQVLYSEPAGAGIPRAARIAWFTGPHVALRSDYRHEGEDLCESKLGTYRLRIIHPLRAVEGLQYGTVARWYRIA